MSDTEVIKEQMVGVREDIGEIKGALSRVADALERLARLEERHATVASALDRAFGAIKSIDLRLKVVELAQPVQRLTSGWIVTAVAAGAGSLATIVITKVIGV